MSINMQKEYRKEVRQLMKQEARIWSDLAKEKTKLDQQREQVIKRTERTFAVLAKHAQRAADKVRTRRSILEGRLA